MKKYIVLLFLVILFGFTFAFRRPLYNLYRTYLVKEQKQVTFDNTSATINYENDSWKLIMDMYYCVQ